MLKFDTIKSTDEQFVMQTYKRLPALFVQGAGCSLWDNRGNEYLDLLAGIAVCNLGHCHPAVVSAITRQAQQLIHVSNFGLTAPQAQLAKRLCELSGMDRVFYTTCGASANETALKIAKKHGTSKRPDGDYEIITLHRSFHGRTLGALSATGQRKYQRPFEPLIPGFMHVEVNDIAGLKEAVGHKTAAIVFEPIQGEGGVMPLTTEYLKVARDLCDEYGALLILDEVQTGIGRTGTWFNFQQHGIEPDVLCLAKGLGGGVPIGVCLARGGAAEVLEAGDHGATFGGNPLSCAAGLAVLDAIEHYDLLENAKSVGAYLSEGLRQLGGPIKTVRGPGLMIGAILDEPIAREIVSKAFDKKLIINATDEHSLRFVPPLILTYAQVDQALAILADVMNVNVPVLTPHASRPTPKAPAYHDILAVGDLSDAQLEEVLDLASFLKQRRKLAPSVITPVEGRSVALVFEKPSLRTRVSFETAIRELGGHPIYLSKADIGMNTRESARDIASNLARWCSMIVARLYWQKDLELLAEIADVPVINALTEMEHPCQALADMMTVQESFGQDKIKIAYIGDGNNVSRSLAKMATRLGYPMTICGPANFRLEEMPGLHQTDDLEEGLANASVVYTDVWISMGDEHEQEHRLKVFDPYQVNSRMMEIANKDAIFLHCLPARRGYEVTDEVIDGKQSRVVDQAENRLHAQKALLQLVMGL
ncbi:MAG: acetylornithine transaminase [Chlorobia bacterium]|nr:acetylornithine transaminase [Fimbriimonadaceae bacterium]